MRSRMSSRISKRWLCSLLALTLLIQSVSCGTILYPERVGQTRGALDYKVVALDTIGLLLFVVPGAVAFAVDFYNGTIYLPGGSFRGQSPEMVATSDWESIPLPTDVDSQEKLQQFLSQETGHSIVLEHKAIEVYKLKDLPTEAPVTLKQKQDERFFGKIHWKKMLTLGLHQEKAPVPSRTEVF